MLLNKMERTRMEADGSSRNNKSDGFIYYKETNAISLSMLNEDLFS